MTRQEALEKLAEANAVLDKLRAIRALWVGAHVTPHPTDKIATEFYYAAGDILEGIPLAKVLANLKNINAAGVQEEIDDLSA